MDKSKADYREFLLDKENNQKRDSIKVLWDYLMSVIKKYHLSKTDNELEGITYKLSDDNDGEIIVQIPKGEGISSGELIVNKVNKMVEEFFDDEDYPQSYYTYYLDFTDKNGEKYKWRHRAKVISRFIKKLKGKYKGKFEDGGLSYAKGGKVIIQPNDYQKYRKIGIENKYEIEAFNDIGLSGINFDSVTLNNLLKKKFNDLLESYKDYVISEDSEAITRTIQQEIEARKLQGDSLERIKEYEEMLTNSSERERYIKDYADNQSKILSEWVSYLKQSEYSIAFRYLLLKAVLNYNYDYKLNKLIERNNKTVRNFVGFDAASLSELNQLNSDYLLKDYTEIQANNSANILNSKEVIKSSGNGKWIKFNGGTKTNYEERVKNAKELSQLVQNTYWCTKTNSQSQLNGGDFYVYVTETNGEVFPRIAIRMDEDNVGEVRGNKIAAQDIEEEMLPIAEDFLINNIPNDSGKKWLDSIKYNSSVIAFKERLIAEGTLFENSIELFFELKIDEKKYLVDYAESNGNLTEAYDIIISYIKKLKNNQFYKKTDFHIGNFDKKDLKGLTANGKFIDLKYIFGDVYAEDIKIKDLGNLKIIGGSANFSSSQIKNLGNLTAICGDADFAYSKLEKLDNITFIGGNLHIGGSEIKDLGNLISIGGYVFFGNTQVENLGNLTNIIGDSDFRNSQVENLGNLTSIGGSADFEYSKVENLGNLTTIGSAAIFSNSQIVDLGNLKNIGGSVNFENSQIVDLGNLTTIGRDAYFGNSEIQNLGNLTSIGNDADFKNSQIENLGNLTTIGGDAFFDNSQVQNLGNLTSIGESADFQNSEIENLGNLTTIGGLAYFRNSKITNLGNLRNIGQGAVGGESLAYKLWVKRKKAIEKGKFENGGYLELLQLPDLLSSQEVAYKLGRELDWWNDDIVYLSGIEYKKVYLRPEYKRVI
jgi:hypothetical protein